MVRIKFQQQRHVAGLAGDQGADVDGAEAGACAGAGAGAVAGLAVVGQLAGVFGVGALQVQREVAGDHLRLFADFAGEDFDDLLGFA